MGLGNGIYILLCEESIYQYLFSLLFIFLSGTGIKFCQGFFCTYGENHDFSPEICQYSEFYVWNV